jgi:hypothetical protein
VIDARTLLLLVGFVLILAAGIWVVRFRPCIHDYHCQIVVSR